MREQSHSTNAHRRTGRSSQRGSIIVYLIVALVTFGVLAIAGLTRFGATVTSILSPNCATSARLMAESGVRYAMARLRACATATDLNTAIAAMNGTTYTVNATAGQSFTLSIGYNSSTYIATVTATGNGCTVASPVVTASVTNVNLPVIAAAAGDGGVSFASDITSFSPTTGFSGATVITVDTTAKTVALGNFVSANSGAVWYTGTNSFCTTGNCTIGTGLCAYWEYQFNSASQGDGYVWTIMSGDTNISTSAGGATNMGELMGYGGLGASGLGILPPKLGLEFDAYYNGCASSICSVGSRCDATSRDHVAFMFWGAQTTSPCDKTYDDNQHQAGAGNASEPVNSYSMDGSGDGWDGYYYRPGSDDIWMERGDKYVVRYELDRPTTANAQGNYVYLERAWVKKATDTYSANMSNCSATNTDAPTLSRSFALTPALHAQLTKGFFGFTEGTGGATQYVTLSNFTLKQKSAPTTPTTPTVPSDYVAAYTFSEAQGSTTSDLSGNGNTLTGSGSAMWAPDVRTVSGASLFVAGSGLAYANDANSLDLTSAGTVACWIKFRNYLDYGGLVHKGQRSDWADEAYSLQLTSSRKFGLYINSTTQTQFLESAANALPNNNQWYHVAATWDGSKIYLYVNGVLNASKNNSSPKIIAQNSSGRLYVGAQLAGPGSPFDGMIDDVYLYNRALTATEIANLALGHP